ncbi:MAG: iron-containing alcohol dehydrogenase [Neisseriaceae bacterium]|nr:iron-containing alcohol dehydrogenase [Neisseriaceae bacterium]
MMALNGNWHYPTAIRFGAGRRSELAEACRGLNIQRPLLVTDSGLSAMPWLAAMRLDLQAAGLTQALFSDVRANPGGRDVAAGVQAYRAGSHDGVVAVGGGSALDVGKTIALMAGQTRVLWDFEDEGANWERVDAAAMAPCIAVPTTAGTGSEVGRAAVIVDEAAKRKVIIFHPHMLPQVVIADPELCVGLPPHLTAATGIDALVHNLEAFCAPSYHPLAQGVALEGLRLIHDYLPRAYADGADIEARGHMLAASLMGATAFQKGLGAVHALAHPIGAVFDVHHGLANAILLPYVLQRNRDAIATRLGPLSLYLGLPEHGFRGVLQWVLTLRAALGIPASLSDVGIDMDQADAIAAAAKRDPSDGGNPMLWTQADYRAVFEAAVKGRLDHA